MVAEGFTIGSHTRSHPKLVQLSPIEMEAEIVASSQIVAEITGAEVVPFSFPNSGTGVERRLLADIRSRHPLLGLFFDTKGIRLDEDFILNRIWAERPKFAGKGRKTKPSRLVAQCLHRTGLGRYCWLPFPLTLSHFSTINLFLSPRDIIRRYEKAFLNYRYESAPVGLLKRNWLAVEAPVVKRLNLLKMSLLMCLLMLALLSCLRCTSRRPGSWRTPGTCAWTDRIRPCFRKWRPFGVSD